MSKANQILARCVVVLSVFLAGVAVALAQQNPGATAPKAGTPPVASPPTTGSPKQLFNNWMYSCEEGACQVFLTLADSTTKEAKFAWSFLYDPKSGKLSTIVQLPLMVALPPGVRVWVNDKTNYTWPFQFCDGSGCRAVAVLTDEMFASLKAPEKTTVQFISYGSPQASNYQISMGGLAAATEKMIADAKAKK